MRVDTLPTASLRPYARNPRDNDAGVDAVARSIAEFGFRVPIVVDEDLEILAGHTRFKAALRLGLAEVPVHVATGLSAAQKRAYRIADNKVAEASSWNMELLERELADLREWKFDLSLTGFGAGELAEILDPSSGKTDPDAVPPVPVEPTARLGDLWILGPHRVVCGDATDAAVVSRACAGAPVEVVWTDPPYNVNYHGKAGTILNDAMADAEFARFLRAAFGAAAGSLVAGGSIYVAHPDGDQSLAFRTAFRDAGFKLSTTLIWRKDHFTLSRADYQLQHEPIMYGWKLGAAHRFFGGRKQSTVSLWEDSPFTRMPDGRWRIEVGDTVMLVDGEATVESLVSSVMWHERPRVSLEHPTMKPVGLIERMLKNSARPGEMVLDPFGGSGSTLIAADRLGMRARLVELDPRFVDVIVRRWEEYSGQSATLVKG